MKLAECQEQFWRLATRADEERDAGRILVGTDELGAEERIRIYANMFIWRQIDALREDFPKLAALLGDEGFYQVAERYLAAHPSTHPSLSRLGDGLPTWLDQDQGRRPDLADLARLELARNLVFDEAEVELAKPELLREVPQDAVPELRLELAPSVRLLSLAHDSTAAWKQIEDGFPAPPPQPGRAWVAVWRKGYDVFHIRLEADEARALRGLQAGEPLGVVCEAFSDRPDAVDAAFRAVTSWFVEGWIREPPGGSRQ
jgi:hypothetical protein